MSEEDVKGDSKENTTDINLSSRGLTQLTEKIVKNFGATARRLDLTDNEIKSGALFDQMTALEVLVLDKNNIETFEAWPVMKNVTTLWLNNNKISDINGTMDFIAKTFPNLSYLSMMKNPACPNMYFSDGEAEAYQRYSFLMLHQLMPKRERKQRNVERFLMSLDRRIYLRPQSQHRNQKTNHPPKRKLQNTNRRLQPFLLKEKLVMMVATVKEIGLL